MKTGSIPLRLTWAQTSTVNLQLGAVYRRETKYELLAKYAPEMGTSWTTVDRRTNNVDNVTETVLPPVAARFLRLTTDRLGEDRTARIAEVELYGN